MSDTAIAIFNTAKEKAILYWGIGFYVLLFSMSGLATCILGALVGTNWSTLDGQSKFMIYLTIFINWSTIMMAFFNKAVNKLKSGDLPIATDDTTIITQQQTKTTAIQQTLGGK